MTPVVIDPQMLIAILYGVGAVAFNNRTRIPGVNNVNKKTQRARYAVDWKYALKAIQTQDLGTNRDDAVNAKIVAWLEKLNANATHKDEDALNKYLLDSIGELADLGLGSTKTKEQVEMIDKIKQDLADDFKSNNSEPAKLLAYVEHMKITGNANQRLCAEMLLAQYNDTKTKIKTPSNRIVFAKCAAFGLAVGIVIGLIAVFAPPALIAATAAVIGFSIANPLTPVVIGASATLYAYKHCASVERTLAVKELEGAEIAHKGIIKMLEEPDNAEQTKRDTLKELAVRGLATKPEDNVEANKEGQTTIVVKVPLPKLRPR